MARSPSPFATPAGVLKVKRLGGIIKVAKRLLKAKNAERRALLVANVFGAGIGVDALISGCTPRARR